MSAAVEMETQHDQQVKNRRAIVGNDLTVLSDIYDDECNMAIWRRNLLPQLQAGVDEYLQTGVGLQASMTLAPENAYSVIHEALSGSGGSWQSSLEFIRALSEDIAELVGVFCCLFDLSRAGLRLTSLDKAMCPRFHVDKVPCRLVTTYSGQATQWLPHADSDRSKLGHGSQGKADENSGLIKTAAKIQNLNTGDVALLKGERWEGNEGAGLVHRSPALAAGERRLLLTLDFN